MWYLWCKVCMSMVSQVVYEDANTAPWSSHTEDDEMDFGGGMYAPQTAFTELMTSDEEIMVTAQTGRGG